MITELSEESQKEKEEFSRKRERERERVHATGRQVLGCFSPKMVSVCGTDGNFSCSE